MKVYLWDQNPLFLESLHNQFSSYAPEWEIFIANSQLDFYQKLKDYTNKTSYIAADSELTQSEKNNHIADELIIYQKDSSLDDNFYEDIQKNTIKEKSTNLINDFKTNDLYPPSNDLGNTEFQEVSRHNNQTNFSSSPSNKDVYFLNFSPTKSSEIQSEFLGCSHYIPIYHPEYLIKELIKEAQALALKENQGQFIHSKNFSLHRLSPVKKWVAYLSAIIKEKNLQSASKNIQLKVAVHQKNTDYKDSLMNFINNDRQKANTYYIIDLNLEKNLELNFPCIEKSKQAPLELFTDLWMNQAILFQDLFYKSSENLRVFQLSSADYHVLSLKPNLLKELIENIYQQLKDSKQNNTLLINIPLTKKYILEEIWGEINHFIIIPNIENNARQMFYKKINPLLNQTNNFCITEELYCNFNEGEKAEIYV